MDDNRGSTSVFSLPIGTVAEDDKQVERHGIFRDTEKSFYSSRLFWLQQYLNSPTYGIVTYIIIKKRTSCSPWSIINPLSNLYKDKPWNQPTEFVPSGMTKRTHRTSMVP